MLSRLRNFLTRLATLRRPKPSAERPVIYGVGLMQGQPVFDPRGAFVGDVGPEIFTPGGAGDDAAFEARLLRALEKPAVREAISRPLVDQVRRGGALRRALQ